MIIVIKDKTYNQASTAKKNDDMLSQWVFLASEKHIDR